MNRTERDRVEPSGMTAQAGEIGRGMKGSDPRSRAKAMTEQNENRKKLNLVSSDVTSKGGARKQRRLAAAIAAPEPNRPRLPAQVDTSTIFDTQKWRERWCGIRAVAETTGVYVAGCTGSMSMAQMLGLVVLKPGTARDVDARMAKLNGERHGSVSIRDFAVHDEPGWSDWEPSKLSARPTHPASPVRVLPRQLSVELPFWVTPQDFEALLVAALEPVTLAHLAASPVGRDLCRRRGVTTDALLRYTRSARGPVLATEVAVVAPSADAGRLVALVEWIVVSLVTADDGWEA